MRNLIIILLCGIIAIAADAGSPRRGDRPKDNANTNTPVAAVTPAPSAPRAAAPSFGNAGRPASVSYTPAPVSQRSPAPAAQTSVDNRRGSYSFPGTRSSAPTAVSNRAPVSASQNSGDNRRNPYSLSGNTRQNTPAAVSSPARVAVTQPSGNSSYRPGGSARERGNTTAVTPVERNSTQVPVTSGQSNAGRRSGGPSGSSSYYQSGNSYGNDVIARNSRTDKGGESAGQRGRDTVFAKNTQTTTSYTPGDSKRESSRPGATDDRTTRRTGDSSATSERGAPGTGYRPGNATRPGGPPSNTGHSVNRPSDNRSSFGGGRTYSTGNTQRRTNYTVGYRPTKAYVPHDYRPPTYQQGRYHYAHTYHPKPCYFGYWAPSYAPGFSYRSVYFNFGLFPYLQVTRISSRSYTSVSYVSEPIYIGGNYYRSERYDRLDEALADIRSGWISGRNDLIERHVRPGQTIAVLLDGQYDYSVSSDDYLGMTRDAIMDLNTTSFVWDTVRERGDGMVTAYGEHAFRSADKVRTVYVTYTFQKVGRDYFLTEVGSSEYPLD